ncbi:hypothetical protein, variant [Verruconis gallopava]|uniref:Rad4 beta-hairpin domain-containing protein n=1 Tax=Verruconis gallopava TaxID=253628 RepID=A0A0D2AC41_9PEZI|nr:hypothetical protein, variant [Verruconis gallopava]KIW04418.1 hypothetical protein, variant [Verruconis gallopava]
MTRRRTGGRVGARITTTARGNGSRILGNENDVPDVYREMMREDAAATVARTDDDDSRPRKKPRRAGDRVTNRAPLAANPNNEQKEKTASTFHVHSSPPADEKPARSIEQEKDSDSELEFEDVHLASDDHTSADEIGNDTLPELMKGLEDGGLSIVAKAPGELATTSKARKNKKRITSAERSVRLALHKMHAILKKMVPFRTVQLLNPDLRASQAQSSSFFLLGLNQITDLFFDRFQIESLGMQRPQWVVERDDIAKITLHDASEKPTELSDFRRAAQSLKGSADLGAQLFCCLLRAVGVEARLVCSLQVLGFASTVKEVAEASNAATPVKKTLYLHDFTRSSDEGATGDGVNSLAHQTSSRIARVGQPRATTSEVVSQTARRLSGTRPRVERPAYPVFWVEAFNSAHQKWIAIDPIATHTVNKPARLEPGVNDARNSMCYVFAFEEDGVARDVTRRYAKAFTAKTRKLRVESTDGGARWLRKALKLFSRVPALDRDALEDAELTAKAAAEGIPKNVLDFKNHPLFALERHLRRNEVIYPKTESGRINVGTANKPKFESVYRRSNVHVVKSAAKWFRLGREIKMGEQPMKHAMPRKGVRVTESPLETDTAEHTGVGLYAVFQTKVYVPPPVVNGKIPKNAYGNIDVFVPSMIPEGAVWIRAPEAKQAARILSIDYADAVTGFDFQRRHGTARIDGVVVAEECFEAMEIVCEAIRETAREEREEDKKREVLRLWRRFIVGLKEARRIEGYLRDNEQPTDSTIVPDSRAPGERDDYMLRDEEEEDDGGNKSRLRQTTRTSRATQDDGGGFLLDSGDESDMCAGGFIAETSDDDGRSDAFLSKETVTKDKGDDEDDEDDVDSDYPLESERSSSDCDQPDASLIDAANGGPAKDEYPFGFTNIRVPVSSRRTESDGHQKTACLARVIRGMRRSGPREQEQRSFAAGEATSKDSRSDGDNGKPMDRKDDRPDNTLGDAVTKDNAPKPIGSSTKAEQQRKFSPPLPRTGDFHEAENHAEKSDIQAPVVSEVPDPDQVEEPPVSSYEYDEDMLEEDPEDEDAEPEWLA